MTSFCVGGTSGPRFGVQEIAIFGAEEISVKLAAIGGMWADVAIGLIGILTYEVGPFCAAEPPAERQLTNTEWNSILKLDAGFPAALQQLVSNLGHQFWFDICQCTQGTTPTAGAFPPAPSGIGTGGSSQSLAVCPVGSTVQQLSAPWAEQDFVKYVLQPYEIPSHPPSPSTGSNPWAILPQPVPTSIHVDWSWTGGPAGQNVGLVFYYWNNNTLTSHTDGVGLKPPDSPQHYDSPVPAGMTHVQMALDANPMDGYSPSANIQAYYVGNCGVATTLPCCNNLQTQDSTMLSQILQLVADLSARMGNPTQAYGSLLSGPVTTGLTGAGTLDATGAIGVRIDLTTIPSHIGSELGNPTALFDVGWLTPLSSQGPTAAQRIRYRTQVFFFPVTVQKFDYYLTPGVVATATLLDGGP